MLLKKINLLIEKKDKAALGFLPKLNSELMKVAKTGIVKRQMPLETSQGLQKELTLCN